jgi:hypothetical protein
VANQNPPRVGATQGWTLAFVNAVASVGVAFESVVFAGVAFESAVPWFLQAILKFGSFAQSMGAVVATALSALVPSSALVPLWRTAFPHKEDEDVLAGC